MCQPFIKLAAIAQRDDVEQYFAYNLKLDPMALFKKKLMRKPDKAALRNALLREEIDIPVKQGTSNVTGDGALLHRVPWVEDIKFCDTANQYVCYVRRNYGSMSIVFEDEMTLMMRCK